MPPIPLEVIIPTAIIAIVFLVLLFFAGKKWFLFIQLSRRKSIPIGRAFRGTVEISGKAKSEIVKTSPFSKRECAYYKYEVQKYVSSGKSGHWDTRKKARTKEPVVLDDGTGTMRIDMNGADIDLKKKYYVPRGNTLKELIKALKTFDSTNVIDVEMESSGSGGRTLGGKMILGLALGGDKVRCVERAIFPGDELYAYGTVDRRRVMSSERGKLVISDRGEKAVQSRTLFFAILLTTGIAVMAGMAFLVLSGAL